MMELLPTFWSPTRTILNFWMELRLLEKLILSLIFIIKQLQIIRTCPPPPSLHFSIPFVSHYKQKYYRSIMSESSSQSANNISEFNRFLNNNTGFIHEKYDKHYDQEFAISHLTEQEYLQKSLKFIYDIFSFQKYESNPKLNTVLRKGLTDNVRSFVEITIKNNPNTEFNKEESVRLLKFCIENNDMFAVQYDKKNKKKNEQQQEQKHPEKQPQASPQIEHKQLPQHKQPPQQTQHPDHKQQIQPKQQPEHKEQKEEEKTEKPPATEEPSPKVNQPEPQPHKDPSKEVPPQVVQQSRAKKLKSFFTAKEKVDEIRCSNEFDEALASAPQQENVELIRKQLKNLFDFYCKQQQNVTPNSTFDIINHKCQTMNLGKFLFFAVAANLVHSKDKAYSEARIDKKTAISLFKRLAEGQREIDFRVFAAILEQMHKSDEQIYSRMGLGEEKGKSKVVENLKYFNLPFSTRDQTGREVSPHGRVFVPKLTTHSGKIEDALREELVLRKERPYMDSSDRMAAEKTIFRGRGQSKGLASMLEDPKETSKFTLKLGQSSDGQPENLKFLSKLITHEQNDQIFLKDYYLPAKKSAHSNKEKGLEVTFDESGRYTKQESSLAIDRQLAKNAGEFTVRPGKDHLVLPLIKQKQNPGMLTERRSLGLERRNMYKL